MAKKCNFAPQYQGLMQEKSTDEKELIKGIVKGIESVKGENITILDLRKIENRVCNYFIVCDGTSSTQINAISHAVEKMVSRLLKEKAWHIEGQENAQWVLMDYVHVVLHIFQKNIRSFYNIEDLWGDAIELPIETI